MPNDLIFLDDNGKLPFKDTAKVPQKIYTDFFLNDEDDDIGSIWAEKSDYLNDDNLGEGLSNKELFLDEKNSTYVLTLDPATKTSIGGVKIGSGLSIDKQGVLSIPPAALSLGGVKIENNTGLIQDLDTGVVSLAPATNTTIGGIKVGEGLSTDNTGLLDLIPATTANIGGIRLGRNLRSGLHDSVATHVYCDRLINYEGLTTTEKNHTDDEKSTLDFIVDVLLNRIEKLQDQVQSIQNLSQRITGSLISGNSLLNGNFDSKTNSGGTLINLNKTMLDSDYYVIITPASLTKEDLGEIYVTDKTNTSFRVCNTGDCSGIKFNYLVIPSDIVYTIDVNGEKNLPIQKGRSKFNLNNNEDGIKTITNVKLDESFDDTRYVVFVTPVSKIENKEDVGEYWVENKLPGSFNVITDGNYKGEIEFEWIAIAFDQFNQNMHYNKDLFPIRCGVAESNNGVVLVNLDTPCNNNLYKVFLQQSHNCLGNLGDYWSSELEKTNNLFTVNRSGKAKHYTVDWIVID